MVRVQHRSHALLIILLCSIALLFALGRSGEPFTPDQLKITIRDIGSDIETTRVTLAQARFGRVSSSYVRGELDAIQQDLTRTIREMQLARVDASLEPRLTRAGEIATAAAEILRRVVSGPIVDSQVDARLVELGAALHDL